MQSFGISVSGNYRAEELKLRQWEHMCRWVNRGGKFGQMFNGFLLFFY